MRVGALDPLPVPRSWADLEGSFAAAAGVDATAVGYLAYEAGAWAQPVAVCPNPNPAAWFGACPSSTLLPSGPSEADLPPPSGSPARWSSAGAYEQAVFQALRHIREGDCYQVNLAREVWVEDPGDPLHAWLRLARSNPARRAMMLYTGSETIVSNSPELLLAVRGRSALSVPIKGTRPAAADPLELLHSAKERAELTMIVDLVRADLANVARVGTVRAGSRRVGRVGHLWHAMQRVRAELEQGRTSLDALKAVFPAGSVTGAPRVRATELIAELEGRPRGPYCGTMGWQRPDGTAAWNVAIRTMWFSGPWQRPDRATMHFGAGIVWGSDPVRERVETEWKAQRMLAAICCP